MKTAPTSKTQRLYELDLAKGFAIIFMVLVHVYESFSTTVSSFSGFIIDDILGSPYAAPIFMISMGIGICYSRRNAAKDLAKRGLMLYATGFVLNFLRDVLPAVMASVIYGEAVADPLYYLAVLFQVDILEFAGLAFLSMALFKKLKLGLFTQLTLALAFSALASFVNVTVQANILANLLGHLLPTNGATYFPLANWLIFPIAGLVMGQYLKQVKDRKSFYQKFAPAAFLAGNAYILLVDYLGLFMASSQGSYYFLTTVDALFIILLAIGWFGVLHLLFYGIDNALTRTLAGMSRQINTIYMIHWVLLGFLSYLVPVSLASVWLVILTAGMILSASYALTVWYQRLALRQQAKSVY